MVMKGVSDYDIDAGTGNGSDKEDAGGFFEGSTLLTSRCGKLDEINGFSMHGIPS